MTPEEIVERAAEVLLEARGREPRPQDDEWPERYAQALAAAGLLPTGVEWAVRGRRFINVRRYGEDGYDFKTRGEAEQYASHFADDTHVVWRTATGPWTEVTS